MDVSATGARIQSPEPLQAGDLLAGHCYIDNKTHDWKARVSRLGTQSVGISWAADCERFAAAVCKEALDGRHGGSLPITEDIVEIYRDQQFAQQAIQERGAEWARDGGVVIGSHAQVAAEDMSSFVQYVDASIREPFGVSRDAFLLVFKMAMAMTVDPNTARGVFPDYNIATAFLWARSVLDRVSSACGYSPVQIPPAVLVELLRIGVVAYREAMAERPEDTSIAQEWFFDMVFEIPS